MSEKLSLFASALYSAAEATWDDPRLAFPEAVEDPILLNNYPIDQMGDISRYSELEYNQTDLKVGGSYAFSPALYATAELAYQIFEDEDPYVYGDQDGEAVLGYVAMGYRF